MTEGRVAADGGANGMEERGKKGFTTRRKKKEERRKKKTETEKEKGKKEKVFNFFKS